MLFRFDFLKDQPLGTKVNFVDLNNSDGNVSFGKEKAIININNNKKKNWPRQRFTLAHEIGHVVNDWENKTNINCTINENLPIKDISEFDSAKELSYEDKELRANQFAADLLMPDFMFLKSLENRDINIETCLNLAKEYQTSISSTILRVVSLSQQCMCIAYAKNDDKIYSKDKWLKQGERWFFSWSKGLEGATTIKDYPFYIPERHELNKARTVKVEKWIRSPAFKGCDIVESIADIGYAYIALLWFKA